MDKIYYIFTQTILYARWFFFRQGDELDHWKIDIKDPNHWRIDIKDPDHLQIDIEDPDHWQIDIKDQEQIIST